MPDFDAVEAAVRTVYPNAHRQGSAGGWSWADDDGIIVAASCPVMTFPFGRHWLAVRKVK